MTTQPRRFYCDLTPRTDQPRIRMNFANGWACSLIICCGGDGIGATLASVAACPVGRWGTGFTELLENEASPDEVAALLKEIADRPALAGADQ